jgi:predicted DNA-binding protein
MDKSQTLTIRVPVELIEKIDNFRKYSKRSRNFYVNEALRWRLDDIEKKYRELELLHEEK